MTARTWRGMTVGLLLVLVLKVLGLLDFLAGFLFGLFGLDGKNITVRLFANVVVGLIVIAIVLRLQSGRAAKPREVVESDSDSESELDSG